MKKILAVGAVTLAVTSAHANNVKFGDLNYFLKQGQINIKSDLDLSREETRQDGVRTEVEGYVSRNRFAFVLMDNIPGFVGFNYLYEMDTQTTGVATSENNGLQNPILGVDLRVLNQTTSGLNLDVGAVVDYNLMDSEVAAPNKDNGNQPSASLSECGDPRSPIGVNARIGNKWNEANEWYALAAAMYHLSGEQRKMDDDSDLELDASLDLKLGAFYQYRPVNEFMMTLGLTATRFGATEGESGGVDLETESFIDYHFTFNAKYLITESFIAKFNYSQDRRGEYDLERKGQGDSEITRRRGNSFGVGIDWLF